MTVKYIGHGEFEHHTGVLPLWPAEDGTDPPDPMVAYWTTACVLDFGNGYVGIAETPSLQPDNPRPDSPQFRITVIELIHPEVAVRQMVVTAPPMGAIDGFDIYISSVPLAVGRVGICMTGFSNFGGGAGYHTTIVSFDEGGALDVGTWSWVGDVEETEYSSADRGMRTCMLLSASGQVCLIGIGSTGVHIRRLSQGKDTMTVATEWVFVSPQDFIGIWTARDASQFVMVNGQIRGFVWILSEHGGYALAVVQFRVDGKGWTMRIVDDGMPLGSIYSGGWVSHITVHGDVTEVTYYKYKGDIS